MKAKAQFPPVRQSGFTLMELLVALGLLVALAALVLIPWSIVDLVRIRRDDWPDLEIPVQTHESDPHH